MKCPGKLFARVLLGQSKLRSKPAQLTRPSFQFGRPFLQYGMTPTEGLFSLLARTDIGDEGNGMSAIGGSDMTQTDFNRKRRPVFPLTHQVRTDAYRLCIRLKVRSAFDRMALR